MNNYKIKHKRQHTDAELQKHKNFNKVLQRQATIKTSYSKVLKLTFGLSALSAIVLSYFIFSTSPSTSNEIAQVETTNNTSQTQRKKLAKSTDAIQNTSISNNIKLTTHAVENNDEPKIIKNEVLKKEKQLQASHAKQKHKNKQIETLIQKDLTANIPEDSVKQVKGNQWLMVSEIPLNERTKLPTLFISKKRWPNVLTKSLLVKNPTIFAIYEGISREAPVVAGIAYIVNENSNEKPAFFKINDHNFPAGLIRAIHSASDNSTLIIKNLQVFIPGQGRVTLGDKRIEVIKDEEYRKNIEMGSGRNF